MKRITTITLITILSLVFIIAISLVLGQDTKNTEEMTKTDNSKLVKNLTINNNLQN
jgi:uncharacterized membrane protein